MSFIKELKRRNVIRVGVAYLVACWLLMQVVDVLTPVFELPGWAPKLIFLILAVGFIPVIMFAWAFEMTPEGIKRESEVIRSESITNLTARKLDHVTIGLLAAVILMVALDRLLPQSTPSDQVGSESISPSAADRDSAAGEVKLTLTPAQAPAKSIAVLPFVNMSDDAGNEYFSDGISEELLNALAKVPDLKVAGRTSSFAFKGQNQDLRLIGEALGVSHILEGSVRKAGNRVRITAQLIKVDDGFHVWSDNYDRELDDVFAIQDEISAAILSQLKAHLAVGESASVARTDTHAYELYLLATQRIYERNQASLQMASDLLQQAVAIDPDYAPAVAQLGIATYLLSEENYGNIAAAAAGKMAKEYFDRALQLDPNQAEAMAGLGLYYFNSQLDYDSGIAWLEKALAINPNLINASVWLSTALGERGELRKSLQILQATFTRDPLHPAAYNNLAQSYAAVGKAQTALDALNDLQRYLPGDAGLSAAMGKVEVLAGNWSAADRLLTQAVEREPRNWIDRFWLGVTAMQTRQYERIAEIGTDNFKALALDHLGRIEEALLLAGDWVSKGNNPNLYLHILVNNGRFEEVIPFTESRWKTLDELERAFPERGGYGAYTLGYLADAYGRKGEEVKRQEAIARMKASLDWQVDQGADNWMLHESLAYYAALNGDHEAALAWLDRVVQEGGSFRLNLSSEFSAFAPLRGDPRFEAVLARWHEHVNAERATLGLEPLSS
jgi:TolB-like protein/Flp pilus assembly protein TadD